jgi:predicted nuclease with TOPRIM domain
MVSRLYNDLQREVEGRKEGLDIQLRQEAALKIELQTKAQELAAKGDVLTLLEAKCNDLEGNLKKKVGENRSLILQV